MNPKSVKQSSRPFEVMYAVLCDYATQERSGKSIMAGIYLKEIAFAVPPPAWNFNLVVALVPQALSFDLAIRFLRPNGRILVELAGKADLTTGPVNGRFTPAVLHMPVSNIRFTGPGTYTIEVRSGDEIIFTEKVELLVGEQPPSRPVNFQGALKVDAEI